MYCVGKDTPYDHWSLWVSTHCDHTPDWEESNIKMWKENFLCLESFSYCNCRIKFRIADVFCLFNKQLLREECTSKIWKQFWSQWMPFLSVHHWLFLWYQHSSMKPIFRALSGNRSWLALCSLTSLEAEHKIGSINTHYSTKDFKVVYTDLWAGEVLSARHLRQCDSENFPETSSASSSDSAWQTGQSGRRRCPTRTWSGWSWSTITSHIAPVQLLKLRQPQLSTPLLFTEMSLHVQGSGFNLKEFHIVSRTQVA